MPLDNPSRASSLNVDAATERTWPHMLVSDSSHKNHLSPERVSDKESSLSVEMEGGLGAVRRGEHGQVSPLYKGRAARTIGGGW